MGDNESIETYGSAVREMLPEERPRERLRQLGAEALRDAELLAVLFRTGTRKRGAVALADDLLREYRGLRGLAQASVEELQRFPGVGIVKSLEIKAALELGRRLAKHTEPKSNRIHCAEDVVQHVMLDYKDREVEHFIVLLLNSRNSVLRTVEISSGGLDATIALPRDVFRQAVRENASAIIVCHNHPSGDPEPSAEDVTLTKRLFNAAEILGLRFLDHVVIGDGRYVSLKERNLF